MRRIALVVVVLLAGAIGYFVWTVQTRDLPAGTLVSSATVTVVPTSYGYVIDPAQRTQLAGMVFLAGAFIGADAYVPFARSLAELGHPVRVVGLEMGVAQLPGQQDRLYGTVASLLSAERPWAVGGHSLGSAYAALFALAHRNDIHGLFMTGTGYPYSDLTSLRIPVIIMAGSNDGVVNFRNDPARAGNLPPRATQLRIAGGNHAQFGYYGPQIMDGTATISRTNQQAQMSAAALSLLQDIDGRSALAAADSVTAGPSRPAIQATHFAVPARLQGVMPQAFRQES